MTLPANIPPGAVLRAAVIKGQLTILDVLDTLPWFRKEVDIEGSPQKLSWTAWRAFLCAVYGLPMTDEELGIFQRCTGRKSAPTQKAREVWCVAGRRARKTAIEALIGVWEATLERDYDPLLAPGEVAQIPMLAKNKADASQLRTYVEEILKSSPAMHSFLKDEPTIEQIELTTRVILTIKAASLMAGRSKTSPCGLFDEVAFFRSDESMVPDREIIDGWRPAAMTVPRAILVCMSSPWSRRGELWRNFDEHWGRDDDRVLIWQAPTLTMHDTPQIRTYVAEEYERDAVSASAEYGAEFRKDLEAFVPIEIVRAVTMPDVFQVPPKPGVHYFAFVDPAGGTGDSFTLGIAHWEPRTRRIVLDRVEEWEPPFKPDEIGVLCLDVLRLYGIKFVRGDHWGGEWPRAIFRLGAHALACKRRKIDARPGTPCDCDDVWTVGYQVSEYTKSQLYQALLPVINSGDVELLDHKKLQAQLVGLDRHASRGGRDSIDHAPGGHDDIANAVAGVVFMANEGRPKIKEIKPQPQTVVEQHTMDIHDQIRKKLKRNQREGGSAGEGGWTL